jgi:hypothetical protein
MTKGDGRGTPMHEQKEKEVKEKDRDKDERINKDRHNKVSEMKQ